MKHRLHKTLFLVVLVFVFFFVLGGKRLFLPQSDTKKDYQYLSLFSEVASHVKTNYVEEVNAHNKFPGAFSGMLSSLDPYSSYLDQQRTATYLDYLQNKYCGTGISGAKVLNYFYVTDVATGSPAQKAGIKPGNVIKAANGKTIFALSYWEMYLALLTKTPQPITITLFKDNRRDVQKITTRTLPAPSAASVTPVKNNILLLELPRFDNAAVQLLQTRLANQKQPLKLIIDLRNYSGGDFQSFLKIANFFFKKTYKISLKYKIRQEEFQVGSPGALQYRAAVIVNPSTRMYGELLAMLFDKAGNSHDIDVKIVGSKTRGFITKLKHIPMQDKSSILLTEAYYLIDGKKTAGQNVLPGTPITVKTPEKIMAACVNLLSSADQPKAETKPVKK